MLEIASRHRPLTLLAATVLAQVLLLAFQIKRERDVRLIRVWSVELLTPLQRAGTWTINKARVGWRDYVDLRHTRAENDRLRSELSRLELRNRELEGRAVEQQRLTTLLNFKEARPDAPMLAAQVIGASADAATHTVLINRGERDGLRVNLGVITPDGVVGKIVEAFPHTAQVLLLNDKESGVGALLATSRTHGVVRGSGDPLARMDYVINDENIPAGEEVLTSGEDRIFPKDLPVGIVTSSQPGNPFKLIRVRPAARLDRLEEVLVLLSQKELTPKKETTPAIQSAPAPLAPQDNKAPTKPE